MYEMKNPMYGIYRAPARERYLHAQGLIELALMDPDSDFSKELIKEAIRALSEPLKDVGDFS